MGNPALNLLVFVGIVLLLTALFWPRRGLLPRLTRRRRSHRRLLEDALKHLAKAEYQGITADVESFAGALRLTPDRAARLAAQLEADGWLTSTTSGLQLTDDGRRYALRIIRHHRLWERYLADRTSVEPAEWHEEAEYREHELDAATADALAARMGDPVYDPHGDPIPTAAGAIPPPHGVALSELSPGESGVVVHIEDEPQHVYDQLIAGDLAPGMGAQVLDRSSHEVRFVVDGRELTLTPFAARNVTVDRVLEAPPTAAHRTMAELSPGEEATVLEISAACQGPERRRLLDLGLVPGTTVLAELQSPLGDPIAYRVRSAVIALRKRQARMVAVSPPPESGEQQ